MNSFTDISIAHRKVVTNSKIRCIFISSLSFVAWAFGLLCFLTAILDPTHDPPISIVLVNPALFCALPFGLVNSLTVYPWLLRRAGFDFSRATLAFIVGTLVSIAITSTWVVATINHELLWFYTGIFCILWTIFAPPAMIGSLLTANCYRKKVFAG